MKTHTITTYSFEELNEEAQQDALEALCDINVNYDWWSFVYEDANEIGLKITSFELDRGKHVEGEFIIMGYDCAKLIIENHGDKCETYKTAQEYIPRLASSLDEEEDGQEAHDRIAGDFLKDLLDDYANILERQYEYIISEEAIKDTIEANEYEFTSNGQLYEF